MEKVLPGKIKETNRC